MKKIYKELSGWNIYFVFIGLVLMLSMFSVVSKGHAAIYDTLSAQVQLGDNNNNVRNLQIFLASDPAIYPQGLTTGYFGTLTRTAVINFQNKYGISPVGRVGPITLDKINALILGGGVSGVSDVSGPQFFSINNSVSNTSATFNWSTNELASAKIFYSTVPIRMNEGDINSVGFGSLNGLIATNDNLARTSQQVTLTNLQPNTNYYYVVVATDLVGNVSVWNPNTIFRTNF